MKPKKVLKAYLLESSNMYYKSRYPLSFFKIGPNHNFKRMSKLEKK